MTLQNTGNELKVAIWLSETAEQFLLHDALPFMCASRLGLTQTMPMLTPVSTRALKLVLKNIENNAEVDYKAQNST